MTRNKQVGDRAGKRQSSVFLQPEELAHRVHFQKDVTAIGGEGEICGAIVEAQETHELQKPFLDLRRKLIRLPPSTTCLTAASRNSVVYFRSRPAFIIYTSTRSHYHTSWRPFFGDQIISNLDQESKESSHEGVPKSCAYAVGLQIPRGIYPEAAEEEVVWGAAAALG